MRTLRFPFLAALLAFGLAAPVVAQPDPEVRVLSPITADMVDQAQRDWVVALVSIGTAHGEGEAAARAGYVLDRYYDFNGVGVVFKPTLASGADTFRLTREAALAYFVGGSEAFPGDRGFALTAYTGGEVDLRGVVAHGDVAIAVSNITLVAPSGDRVTVDKTFGYRLAEDGRLRIISHHSSLPFTPAP